MCKKLTAYHPIHSSYLFISTTMKIMDTPSFTVWSSEEMEVFNTAFLESHSLNSNFLKEYTSNWEKKFGGKYVDNKQYGVSLQNLVIRIRDTHPLEDTAYPTYTPDSVCDRVRNQPRADPLLITDFEEIRAKFSPEQIPRYEFILCSFIKNLLWFKEVLHIDPKKDSTKIFGTICLLTDELNSYMYYLGCKNKPIASILKIVQYIILGLPKITRNRDSKKIIVKKNTPKIRTIQAPKVPETPNIVSVALAAFALLDMSSIR